MKAFLTRASLSYDEYRRLLSALKDIEQEGSERSAAIAAIRLLLLSRRGISEIQKLHSEYFDLKTGNLTLHDRKTGTKMVHSGEPAIGTPRGTRRHDVNPLVNAERKEGSHPTDLQLPWRRVRAAAEFNGVRIHDLRYSVASGGLLVPEGFSIIRKFLGHPAAAHSVVGVIHASAADPQHRSNSSALLPAEMIAYLGDEEIDFWSTEFCTWKFPPPSDRLPDRPLGDP